MFEKTINQCSGVAALLAMVIAYCLFTLTF